MAQPLWAPAALLGCLHGEKPSPYRQAEHILFQSVTIVPHPPAVCCPEEQLSLLSNLLIGIGGQEGTAKMGPLHGGHKQGAPSTGSAHSSVGLETVTSPICSPGQGEVTRQSCGPLRDSSHKQQEAGLGALWCSLGQNGLTCHWVGLETSKVPSNLHSSVIDLMFVFW